MEISKSGTVAATGQQPGTAPADDKAVPVTGPARRCLCRWPCRSTQEEARCCCRLHGSTRSRTSRHVCSVASSFRAVRCDKKKSCATKIVTYLPTCLRGCEVVVANSASVIGHGWIGVLKYVGGKCEQKCAAQRKRARACNSHKNSENRKTQDCIRPHGLKRRGRHHIRKPHTHTHTANENPTRHQIQMCYTTPLQLPKR
jgi:hypothetical protein